MKKIVALFLAVIMLLSSAALAEGMTAGTYQASAQGYHGSIVLKVTVDADKITGIEVVEQSETEGIGAAALPKTADPDHMRGNADMDFTISDADMQTLSSMEWMRDYGEFNIFPVFSGKPLA